VPVPKQSSQTSVFSALRSSLSSIMYRKVNLNR